MKKEGKKKKKRSAAARATQAEALGRNKVREDFRPHSPKTEAKKAHQPSQPPPSDRQRRQHLQRERLRLDGAFLGRGAGSVSPLGAQKKNVDATPARGLSDPQSGAERGVEGGRVEVGPAEELGVAFAGVIVSSK